MAKKYENVVKKLEKIIAIDEELRVKGLLVDGYDTLFTNVIESMEASFDETLAAYEIYMDRLEEEGVNN